MAQAWNTVRIFISSTFRDMHAERDHLARVVFPELRERCAKRRMHVVDLDLRWGVTEEEAEQGKVVGIILDEIDRSGPFFGDRYRICRRCASLEEARDLLAQGMNAKLDGT